MTQLPILIDRPLDNTALAAFMECPRKYHFSMVQHRRRAGVLPPALMYGQVWHKALEVHYKTNGDESEVLVAAANMWQDHNKPDDHRTFQRLMMEYENYRKRWGQRPQDEDAQTEGWPDQPLVELSVNGAWEGALHPYAGKIDRIIRWNGQLYVEDHKTTSQMGAYYFNQFELSNQMMGYAWMAYQLTGQWIAGVRINAHAILKRESKFERQLISFSKSKLEEWAANYNYWVVRLNDAYTRDEWPANFNACAGKYGMCTYSTVCSVDKRIRERVLEQDFVVAPWNPLEVEGENGE